MKKLNILFLTILTIMISSCGKKAEVKSKASAFIPPVVTSIPSAEKIIAQFIDSPVIGLDYSGDDGIIRQTGIDGKFECNNGELISFYIAGKLYIGESSCNEKIFLEQLGSNDTSVINRIAALMLRLNRSLDADSSIDLSNLNQYSSKLDLRASFGTETTDAAIYFNLDGVLNSIKNSDQIQPFGSAENFTSAKNLAKDHVALSVLSHSDVKASETNTAGTFTNWLESKSSNGSIIDLAYGNVFPTVSSVNGQEYCPSGLGALGISLYGENSSNGNGGTLRKYFLNTLGYKNGIRTELSRTRILTNRATNVFNIASGANETLKGTVSVFLNKDNKSLGGIIQLNYRYNDTSVLKAHCEYILDL